MTVQAILGDSRGRPISKEVIYFTTQAKFLNGKGNVVIMNGDLAQEALAQRIPEAQLPHSRPPPTGLA